MSLEEIRLAQQRCLAGEILEPGMMLRLLAIPLDSAEDRMLRRAAREVAATVTGDRGYIWCAMGADYQPCPMNCRFCSLGERWGIVKEGRTYSTAEILQTAARFAAGGADYIVLRTTEYFRISVLNELVARLRKEVPGAYEVILNTGEFDVETAKAMRAAGVDGIYHALRLREGVDTPFAPETRLATLDSVYRSPLKLISLVEPVGPEHTNEEIVDSFQTILRYGASISGAMARVPVRGTPLGEGPRLAEERLAQITAVLRLSGGNVVRDICVHPASAAALSSGANVVVVETGAIPRDAVPAGADWERFGLEQAKRLLHAAGYRKD